MKTVGFALTGSFCTFRDVIPQMRTLRGAGYEVLPVMSQTAYETDTKFGRAEDFRGQIEAACGHHILHTIVEAEPIGPQKMFDVMLIAPATGNTLGKLAHGINDTAVTMAAKSHLRGGRPLVLAVSTNDALGAGAENIGRLLRARHVYFVPARQDAPANKPLSVVADFSLVLPALEAALEGRQLQPLLLPPRAKGFAAVSEPGIVPGAM